MPLKLTKRGYTEEYASCGNCDRRIRLFLNDKGKVRKAYDANLIGDNKLKCNSCESELIYQPEPLDKK
jgi:hypothetical protein